MQVDTGAVVVAASPWAIGWATILTILTPPITSWLFGLWNKADSAISGLDKNVKALVYVVISVVATYALQFLNSVITSHDPNWVGTGILSLLTSIIMTIQARTVIQTTKENAVAAGMMKPEALRTS